MYSQNGFRPSLRNVWIPSPRKENLFENRRGPHLAVSPRGRRRYVSSKPRFKENPRISPDLYPPGPDRSPLRLQRCNCRSRSAKPPKKTTRKVTKKTDFKRKDRYYFPLKVGPSITMDALLDSGSESCLMSKNLFELLPPECRGRVTICKMIAD